MRIVSAFCLLVAVAGGCDHDQGSGAQSDGPAGKVVEVSGSATAVRSAKGARERELSEGDVIYGDDTVATGEDGAVRIRLDHNGAVWSLGAGVRRKLRESVAWKAPKASTDRDLLAHRDEDRTSSAGRHAEKEAADTESTALEESPGAAPAPAPPPQKQESAAVEEERERSDQAHPHRHRKHGARSGLPSGGVEADSDSPLDLELGNGGGEGTRGGGSGDGGGSGGAVEHAKPKKAPASSERARAQVIKIVRRCFDKSSKAPAGKVTVSLEIGEDGKLTARPTLSASAHGLDPVITCARSRLFAASFPPGGGRIRLAIDLAR